jgi:C1A family cysteine protease
LFKNVDFDTIKAKVLKTSLPSRQDLRKWCSPVEDQGQLGSCTANEGVRLVEFFERRAYGKDIDGPRLFVIKLQEKS